MVKIIFLVFCLISVLGRSSASTNIECYYFDVDYVAVGFIYNCIVETNPNILNEESAQISGISGSHQGSNSNDDVLGFIVHGETVQVFPKGLEIFFKNLKMIFIDNCELKEIHQSDLKVFPNLVSIDIASNRIEVIEEGLFDFNPNLEHISFRESKIIHIDPNVFDNLNRLEYLMLGSVPCVGQNTNSEEKILEAIKIVKSRCSNSEFLSFENQIKNLENESKALSSETISLKFESFENNFKNSRFSHFRPLNYKVENLKSAIRTAQIDRVLNTEIPNVNDENLSSFLMNITDKFEDLKSTQCGLKSSTDELKSSQNELQSTLSDIKFLVTDHGSTLDQIPNIQNNCINDVKATLFVHTSILKNLSTSHEQISKKLTDLKTEIDENFESFEDNLKNSESQNRKKIEEIKKELELVHSKLSMAMDSKLKAVESRMMEKIDEKLNKILKSLYIF